MLKARHLLAVGACVLLFPAAASAVGLLGSFHLHRGDDAAAPATDQPGAPYAGFCEPAGRHDEEVKEEKEAARGERRQEEVQEEEAPGLSSA